MPIMEPSKVTPLMRKITITMYGNNAVTYTTFKNNFIYFQTIKINFEKNNFSRRFNTFPDTKVDNNPSQ